MTDSTHISLQDIAKRMHVTPRTVARILSGDYVPTQPKAVKRAQRIRQLATEMGYRTNASARAMRTGRFGTVSLILPRSAELGLLPGGMLTGIDDRLGQKDIHLTICHTDLATQQQDDPTPHHKVIQQSLVDGHMIDILDHPPAAQFQLPPNVPNIWLRGKRDYDCIYTDERKAGYDATRHLLELGHRKIVAAYGQYCSEEAAFDRLEGFKDAMREAGLTPRELVMPDTSAEVTEAEYRAQPWVTTCISQTESRMPFLKQWLATDEQPDAVLGLWFNDALSVQAAALHSGMSIPNELAIVSFHDRLLNAGFPITTFNVSMTSFGRIAAEMMLEKIENPDRPLAPVVRRYDLMPGMTT
ncbi:MAG: LacI family DNA-binding transcriptional regulator [Planctomycetota bacterium]